ncbi:uncharacterized protein LOC127838817 [Dreissena polymorpha]|uniref:VWFA domain-containing protein n=1 Tax=Dreissena polymorpha TaxID=45954 RepID=A0A9D4F2I8_DREPO|nr:uncharacterized protein LOC127838817 [Dreissena polymorpha]KAH3791199.1 hypothetical protein DPMN_144679 [Dreissena polymorpha]
MERGSLIGLLLDVSGSMKENAVGSVEEEGEWVRSLFQVIDDVIKHDVNENNRVFTIGFGGQSNDGTFDILKSVDKAQQQKETLEQGRGNVVRKVVTTFTEATPSEIRNAIESGIALIKDNFKLTTVNTKKAIESVQTAAKIIRGTVQGAELTDRRRKELLNLVKPFIYGGTPIESALTSAMKIFQDETRPDVKKVMIVISDGEWSDTSHFPKTFEELDVTIVCCFVSRSSNIRPRHLFDTAEINWESGAKKMFELSSDISSQLLPRTMILQNGWSFDIEKNKTKLFAHVNNPEHMREICRLGKKIACNQECLSELLVTVSLDMYINQSNTGVTAPYQVGGTCYAHASATAIHLTLKRIIGRDGGHPSFESIRDEIIRENGYDGANTFGVLKNVCPRYRLQCTEINGHHVFRAIVAKRIIVAKFRLTDREWDVFRAFYLKEPKRILSKKDLDIRQRSHGEQPKGHAVVVTSYTNDFLVLMNSWGVNWADNGFFRVESADVLGLECMDVYWTESDLLPSERNYFKLHGSEVAKTLVSKLRGLQMQTYKCPVCSLTSPINTFKGTLSRATCPQCHDEFKCSEAGNILAMNIYLTSIATSHEKDITD